MTNPVGHTQAGVDTPVTLINAFSVPLSQGDRFLSRWQENASFMVGAPGFRRARMYRAMSERAEITFVNVAEWEAGTALDEARRNPQWQASVQRVLEDPELDVVARPMVYEVAVEYTPEPR
ncbi:antibiotic biosynthesis monooxygenase family protein [Amycolatopsis sp. NEAU-NG30]|uniref:Antibiotic biosynthesis monooxygenase family protein n=1 Tax=Amycolatopsis melonis TaxID=3156488 RepID=A0ABV0LME4_9PSEU